MVRPGDIAAPNQAVALVLRADDLWVKAYISRSIWAAFDWVKKCRSRATRFPASDLKATITYIASASEFTPRNVQTIDERRHQVFGFQSARGRSARRLQVGHGGRCVVAADERRKSLQILR